MNDEDRQIFEALIDQSMRMHFRILALVEYLIDHKAIQEKDEAVWKELDARAEQLKLEQTQELWVEERARTLREAWKKLPKQ